jgi:hypothetical protein
MIGREDVVTAHEPDLVQPSVPSNSAERHTSRVPEQVDP